jgi:hypothetical protein
MMEFVLFLNCENWRQSLRYFDKFDSQPHNLSAFYLTHLEAEIEIYFKHFAYGRKQILPHCFNTQVFVPIHSRVH